MLKHCLRYTTLPALGLFMKIVIAAIGTDAHRTIHVTIGITQHRDGPRHTNFPSLVLAPAAIKQGLLIQLKRTLAQQGGNGFGDKIGGGLVAKQPVTGVIAELHLSIGTQPDDETGRRGHQQRLHAGTRLRIAPLTKNEQSAHHTTGVEQGRKHKTHIQLSTITMLQTGIDIEMGTVDAAQHRTRR